MKIGIIVTGLICIIWIGLGVYFAIRSENKAEKERNRKLKEWDKKHRRPSY